MEQISSVRELIDLWPTRAQLATDVRAAVADLKITPAGVHKWSENNSIPSKYHYGVLMAARVRGYQVDAERIAQLHSPAVKAA